MIVLFNFLNYFTYDRKPHLCVGSFFVVAVLDARQLELVSLHLDLVASQRQVVLISCLFEDHHVM